MSAFESLCLHEEDCQQRQAFLGIDEADLANLQRLQPVFAQYAQTFAEQFYEHLLQHPQTAHLLQDPEQVQRLKAIQIRYFEELLQGVFDRKYFEGRMRVGATHQRIGLDPAWYLGAYNQYIQLTFPFFARAFGSEVDKVLPLLLSLVKVIFLDIDLALHTYCRTQTEELRRHNEELQRALRLYGKSQRREEQLRRLLSHEIRGGLAAVITSLEDLRDVLGEQVTSDVLDDVQAITSRCWSLSGVLREMLADSNGGQGPNWVEMRSIYETVSTRFGMYTEGRDIRLHLPQDAPRVWADPAQLREVFANLVSNAVRYMHREPGEVKITCRKNGDFYEFSVMDNGPGIPTSVQERMFGPFVRGPAQPGRPAGTGLGLFFVRDIVEQGGGQVWVESEPGQGTCIRFTVPREPRSRES